MNVNDMWKVPITDDAQPAMRAEAERAMRRALREKLICAALTGLMGQTSASETWYAERAISQADAVLAALDREAAK